MVSNSHMNISGYFQCYLKFSNQGVTDTWQCESTFCCSWQLLSMWNFQFFFNNSYFLQATRLTISFPLWFSTLHYFSGSSFMQNLLLFFINQFISGLFWAIAGLGPFRFSTFLHCVASFSLEMMLKACSFGLLEHL